MALNLLKLQSNQKSQIFGVYFVRKMKLRNPKKLSKLKMSAGLYEIGHQSGLNFFPHMAEKFPQMF
jgi:hypothetical protein